MRLFVALDIESEIRQRIAAFMETVRGAAPGARWVSPESLHVTLKFIGEQPDNRLRDVEAALHTISATPIELTFRGTGFFPHARAARVYWIGIEAGSGLGDLASKVDAALATLSIPQEDRAFSPHLTLARAGNRSGSPMRLAGDRPNRVFAALQEKSSTVPEQEFGTMTAREFYLYESRLSSKGATYTKLARFELRSCPQ